MKTMLLAKTDNIMLSYMYMSICVLYALPIGGREIYEAKNPWLVVV